MIESIFLVALIVIGSITYTFLNYALVVEKYEDVTLYHFQPKHMAEKE